MAYLFASTIARDKALLAGLFLLWAILVPGCTLQGAGSKQVYVVFRYDDYSARSPTDLELRLIDTFRIHKAAITFAVIPFVCGGDLHDPSPQGFIPLSPLKADILRTAARDGVVEVALHGYSHQTTNANVMSEFAGLTYSAQVDRLVKGKAFLEAEAGLRVATFVPPWNSYDLSTLRALEDLGFQTISAAPGGRAVRSSALRFLPTTCDLVHLKDAVQVAQRSSALQPLVVVLFHSYDFREYDEGSGIITYQEFSDLLEWLGSKQDINLLSIGQATQLISDLSARRYLWNNSVFSASSLLPPLPWTRNSALYADSADWWLLVRLWVSVFILYLAVATVVGCLSCAIGAYLLAKLPSVVRIGRYVVVGVSAVGIFLLLHDLHVGMRGTTTIAVLVGASAGTWLSPLRVRRKSQRQMDNFPGHGRGG